MIYVASIVGFSILYGLAYLALDGRYRKPDVVWYTLIVVIGISSLIAFRDVGPAPDDENYVEYGAYAGEYIDQISFSNTVIFILNEPVYSVFNYTIANSFGEYWYFPVFVFISFSVLSIAIYRISGRPILSLVVFILFFPIVKNWYIHLRQGLAISLFFFGVSMSSRKKYLVMFLSSLIHTSMFVSLGSYLYEYLGRKVGLNRVARITFFFVVAALFAWLLEDLLKAIGYVTARRDYKDVGRFASPKVYLTYVVISAGYFLSTTDNRGMMTQFLYGLSLYITMGFSVPYAARVFENYLPFAALSITDATYTKNYYFYAMAVVGIIAILYLLSEHPFIALDFVPFGFSPEDARSIR
ncbi:EpsG family protein [Salinibacter ruber]|uniref:EpsG family protein n=1 Tax=Salinibacter ruber TaxID=146919 RepID=UPI002073B59E|nr:EpsG family protein [Salinibacter ruber]